MSENYTSKYIFVKGAKVHNLKNIDVKIPKDKFVVITGVSGSGKSSLAFDTIYAEGQRRYVESLSPYARQFLGVADKPDVERIEGLSPAISIDQKTTSHNPRSTVGTVTEIYDYLRLLYSKIGVAYCINGHGKIQAQTTKQIIDQVLKFPDETKILILAPVITSSKGTHKNLFTKLKDEGFIRVRVNGQILNLEDNIELEKNNRHNIEIVVDRIVKTNDEKILSRLHEAIEVALENGLGKLLIVDLDSKKEYSFSKHFACKTCGFNIPELEPRLFSFNSPVGACSNCHGLGTKLGVDVDLLIPNKNLSLAERCIKFMGVDYWESYEGKIFEAFCKKLKINLSTPFNRLDEDIQKQILYGSHDTFHYTIRHNNFLREKVDKWEGYIPMIERRNQETTSNSAKEYYQKFLGESVCEVCKGKRLNEKALCVKVHDKNIVQVCELAIRDSYQFFQNLKLNETEAQIAKLVIKEISDRTGFLNNVGLEYLSLSRTAQTLSGGEAQRIRLATQIGSQLSGVLYVLDEPSIGLHQRDNQRLIHTLKSMRNLGNTLIVVEHDEETMIEADWILDIGPGAGAYGGKLVAEGTPAEICENENSLTGQYLSGKKFIEIPAGRRKGNGKYIEITGARENNLKNISVKFPLGTFMAITGVSGSGKSTLINEILVKAINWELGLVSDKPGKYSKIEGLNHVDKIVNVSQDPIGRTPRSNPATYTSVFDDIRDVFANVPEAKAKGYEKGRFSFNVTGGRCDRCNGEGTITISMQFMPDIYVECEECHGKRYNKPTLQIKYKQKNIFDVLSMTIDEACVFFENHPQIKHKLDIISQVGLGYIRLGQPATQLSGGEAQRVKLATYLQKKATGKTIYVLDEPTTGLHIDDVKRLIKVLDAIVKKGDTVLVIEHNLDVIKYADWIIDLGPEGGEGGGNIVAEGTPEDIAFSKKFNKSATKPFLAQYLKKKN